MCACGQGLPAPPQPLPPPPFPPPPVIAIALALITKEVYSSLFIGILVGGLLYSNFPLRAPSSTCSGRHRLRPVRQLQRGHPDLPGHPGHHGVPDEQGGRLRRLSAAGPRRTSRAGWGPAGLHRAGLPDLHRRLLQLPHRGQRHAPITDKHKVSRAKLAYIIDATAAPVCIIAPISSWAPPWSGFAEDGQGLNLFIQAIPYNFYALLTIVMMLGLVLMKVDFGPMAKFERNAIENGDLFSGSNPYAMLDEEIDDTKGKVMDLVLPIVVLVVCCVIGMIYSGGFFSGTDFVAAFSNSGRLRGPDAGLCLRPALRPDLLHRPPVHVLQGHDGLHPLRASRPWSPPSSSSPLPGA